MHSGHYGVDTLACISGVAPHALEAEAACLGDGMLVQRSSSSNRMPQSLGSVAMHSPV